MRPYRGKLPQLPVLPSSLRGYTSIFRSYSKRLEDYYRRSYLSLNAMFNSGNGGLMHLFLIPNNDLHYIRSMMAAYWLSENSRVDRLELVRLLGYSIQTADRFIAMGKRRGHLTALKGNYGGYYQLSPEGHEYIQAVIKSYTDRLLEFYDLK